MQDNQKKYRKKYAVMTVFFLISASFLFGCGNKDSAVPETEEFYFLRKKKSRIIHHKRAKSQQRRQKEKGGSGQRYSGRKSGA